MSAKRTAPAPTDAAQGLAAAKPLDDAIIAEEPQVVPTRHGLAILIYRKPKLAPQPIDADPADREWATGVPPVDVDGMEAYAAWVQSQLFPQGNPA